MDDDVAPEVAVLGPVAVRRGARPFARAWTLDLVVYLTLHPEGADTENWVTALWPDRPMALATVHSTASAARRALGRGPSGDHLPRQRGRLCLAPTVGSDWRRLGALARRADPAAWEAALALVRGRPFDGLRSPDWTVLEGVQAEVEEAVVQVALRLGRHRLACGDGPGAARAARRALRASPFDERLYRQLLRAADQEGNTGAVESVMAELVRVMGGLHPETAALYGELSRRPARTGRALLRL